MTRLLRWFVVIFVLILSCAAQAFADSITLDITALTDGRDQVIIKGNTLQWHHFDFAAVGRHSGLNEPTIITTTFDGAVVMDHVPWIPDWPLPPPDEIRFEAYSSVFTGLTPAIPSQDMTVSLQVIEARSSLQLVQLPTLDNGFTTILEFNDNPSFDHAEYRGLLTFTSQPAAVPEPSGLSLLVLCGALGLGYRMSQGRRRKRG